MISIKINTFNFLVNSNISVLEACQYVGINLPRFCYHEIISVAGNCRMCLVEIEKSPKPIVACAMPISNNISIITNSPLVKKARENILELLLINHPLDCPICDQGGECDLQDQTKSFGGDSMRFFKKKRSVEDKNFGLTIKTIMTRCIHCTRCVRFSEELSGSSFFGTLNRGCATEIGSYVDSAFISEISGNIIDLCPVGALTSKNYAFKTRPWELRSQETIDCTDSFGNNILVNFKETEILRIQPKNLKNLNNSLISDKIRYLTDGIFKNRIQQIFEKVGNNKFKKLNEFKFLDIVNKNFKNNNSKILFIINENLDFKTSLLLQSFSNKNFKILNISYDKQQYTNINLNNNIFSRTKILSTNLVKSCLLLSINLNTECVMLNTKLRIKYNQEDLKIYGTGFKNITTFSTIFININTNKILKIFEGKTDLSVKIFKCKYFLIIFGSSIKKRINNINLVLLTFKNFCISTNLINVELNSNSTGLKFLGIKNINSKNFKKQNQSKFFVNLEDNIFIRKLTFLNSKKEDTFWLNSHGSSIALNFHYILPTLTFFEQENYYLNNDLYLQKTNIIIKTKNNLNIVNDLNKNFKKFFSQNVYSFWNFKKENFGETISKFNLNLLAQKNNNTIINFYPIKSVIEDFFLTNIITKNSEFLLKRSKENQHFFDNYK